MGSALDIRPLMSIALVSISNYLVNSSNNFLDVGASSGPNEQGTAMAIIPGDQASNPNTAFPEFNDLNMDLDLQNTDWMWEMGFTSLLPIDIDSFSAPLPSI